MFKKQNILFILFAVCSASITIAQQNLTWSDFADMTTKPKYNEDFGVYFLEPTFGGNILSYDGMEIKIKGYFLDISGNGEVLLVSKNPMALCFFCGGSGPETIIEVNFKEKPPFLTDDIIEVTGTLKLNTNDVEHCNYILNNATGKLAE